MDKKAELFLDIVDGKYTSEAVKQKIRELEEQFGNNYFAHFDINRKNPPWDMKYLEELKKKGMSGMASKKFFLHLAEVSEYVHAAEKARKRKKCILIGAIAVIIIALVIIALCLSGSHAAAAAVVANKNTMITNLSGRLMH